MKGKNVGIDEMEPKLKGTMFESLIDGFTDLMTSLTNNDPKAWEDLGNKVANITFKVLALTIAIKLLKGTFGMCFFFPLTSI